MYNVRNLEIVLGGFLKQSIISYLNHHKSKNFRDLLFSYIDKSNLKDSDVYKSVDIDRRLFSKIRCNENYIPSKNTIIKLGLALKLDRHRFDKLLNSAGYCLGENNIFDLIVVYCLENSIYDLNVVNDYLFKFCGTVL